MTGWGQDGPLAKRAGHDINYISIAGALWPMGREGERPVPPMNVVGDLGGGGMMLAFGVTSALLEARRTGRGQVVDAAMIDGAASMMTMLFSFHTAGVWKEERGVNLLDTGAHFYEVYETADGRYVGVGAIEPQFYACLIETLGLDGEDLPAQMDRGQWPAMKERFAAIFRTRTRDEWTEIFEGLDACVTPVLSPYEARFHPYLEERRTYVESGGVVQPAPAPRFSATPSEISKPGSVPGADTASALAEWGIDPERVTALSEGGVLS
jgi:alpha-methylacyl-CoA racemase